MIHDERKRDVPAARSSEPDLWVRRGLRAGRGGRGRGRVRVVRAVVLLEHYRTGAFVFEPEDVAAYKSAVDQIRRVAMSPADSLALTAEIAHEMEAAT